MKETMSQENKLDEHFALFAKMNWQSERSATIQLLDKFIEDESGISLPVLLQIRQIIKNGEHL
jgi:hypothetical protein